MKRAIFTVLILSIAALPLFAQGPVAKAKCVSLEHARGEWRMEINCDRGAGSISRVDASDSFRGEGIFATWSQQDLRSLYVSLMPAETERIEILQLG